MDAVTAYILAGALILTWIVAVYYLFKKWSGRKALEARGLSLYGPFVMWRTVKGRSLIEKVASKRRFWEIYGDLAIALAAVAAIVMLSMLLWQTWLVPRIPKASAPTPDLLLGLPGINKFIPIGYGILGLAVAIIVHEAAHGILMRASGFKLKTLGLLMFIVPMGAFAEPDERELSEGARRKRMRVYAGGPAANLVVALVCALVFTMVMVPSVHEAHSGIGVFNVSSGTPADGNISVGSIIYSFNGTSVANYSDFSSSIAKTQANQTVAIGVFTHGSEHTINVKLSDRGAYVSDAASKGKGYLGVSAASVSTARFHPIARASSIDSLFNNALTFITLPVSGFSPVQGPIMDFYTVNGMDAGTFWLLANAVYWIFWLNLMVGLTNVLPAIPLDGGFIFKDYMEKLLEKVGVKGGVKAEQVKLADKVVLAMSVLMLFLIIWPLIGPRILN